MFGPDCHGLSQSKTTKPKRPESRVVQSTIKANRGLTNSFSFSFVALMTVFSE